MHRKSPRSWYPAISSLNDLKLKNVSDAHLSHIINLPISHFLFDSSSREKEPIIYTNKSATNLVTSMSQNLAPVLAIDQRKICESNQCDHQTIAPSKASVSPEPYRLPHILCTLRPSKLPAEQHSTYLLSNPIHQSLNAPGPLSEDLHNILQATRLYAPLRKLPARFLRIG